MDPIRAIITGATGMVGEGVLLTCLQDPRVEAVLIINRKPLGITHPKLKEIIHSDFYDLSPIADQLGGYNACFFCLGISSVGVSKEAYYKVTYTLTMHVAETLSKRNSNMVFCYVSGAGTDSTEQGRSNWARVKGKTENDLTKLPFRKAYGFRPGFIKPVPGQKHVNRFYKYINWMFPIGRRLFPNGFCKVDEIARAMVYVAQHVPNQHIIDGNEMIALGK